MKLTSRFIVLLISILMVMSSTVSVLAAQREGEGGDAAAGAEVNTFARSMGLQEVYLDRSKFYGEGAGAAGEINKNVTVEKISGDNITVDDSDDAKTVWIPGDKLAIGLNTLGDSWKYTYEDAAVFPDGSRHDVVITYTLDHLALHASNTNSEAAAKKDTVKYYLNESGVRIKGVIEGAITGDSENKIGYRTFITAVINVDGAGAYTYLVPFSGVNAGKSHTGASEPLANAGGDEYVREHVKIASNETIYAPTESKIQNFIDPDVWGGNNVMPEKTNANSGSDRIYNSGFVISASNNSDIKFNSMAAVSGKNSSVYNNNMFIELGDLQHRIWSGSGPNGEIKTGKTGTGTGLDGGSFTGDIPSGMPATNTDEQELMRYVVPDAKENVTYTMQPTTAGYFADKVSVDGKTIQIPVSKEEGDTWTFDAGVLKHEGNDVYKFTFNKPNASDHSIYVTWRTTPTADDATSIDGKGVTQTGTPVFVPAEGQEFNPGDFILIDDDGKEQESITVPGEGKYTVDKQTGEVTFVPEPNYVGTANGVTVRGTQGDGQKAKAKYTPTVVETDQTKTVTRNVTFTYKTENGKTASKTVTQTLTFKRTGVYNKETGQVDYPDWEPQTFPAVKAPEIEGWTPNMAEAPALTVLDPNIKVADVHIVYNKIEGDEAGEGVDTSDDNNVKPWVAILLANAMAICALIISRRRRNA